MENHNIYARNCKVKKKSPEKKLYTVNLHKCHRTCFVLAIYCWVWGLALRVVCIPSKTLLDQTKFSCVSSYQLQIASGLWVWARVYSAVTAGTPSDLDLCRPCACCHSVWVHMCILLCRKVFFPWCFPSPLTLKIFLPLVQGSLSPEERELMETPHLGLSVSRSLTVCTLSRFVDLYLVSSTARERFSDGGGARHWSMGIAECH